MAAFDAALRASVTPGAVVVDIGTGPGLFALLACRYGARRVYAIEPDPVIQVARELARANGYADRIEFVEALSTAVSLPERADVIVSDIGGALPWFHQHIPAIIDARRRFLKPGGVVIPESDTAWSVVVEAPEAYAKHTAGWGREPFGFDLDVARDLVVNARTTYRVTEEHALTATQRWHRLDYRTVEDTDVRGTIHFRVNRAGVGHGMATGFERVVGSGLSLSNAPDAQATAPRSDIYGIVLFPWPRPVTLNEGDALAVEFAARLTGEDYVWTWATTIRRDTQTQPVVTFRQSTFHGAPLSPQQLQKRREDYAPTLNQEGAVVRFVLDSMQGKATLAAIADALAAEFPTRFAHRRDAVDYVARWSRLYG